MQATQHWTPADFFRFTKALRDRYHSPLMVNYFRWHQQLFEAVLAEITQRPAHNNAIAHVSQRVTHASGQITECIECFMLLPSPAWPHMCVHRFEDDGYTSEEVDLEALEE